eukprot:3703616-Pyramimonas_sp.AAC.1
MLAEMTAIVFARAVPSIAEILLALVCRCSREDAGDVDLVNWDRTPDRIERGAEKLSARCSNAPWDGLAVELPVVGLWGGSCWRCCSGTVWFGKRCSGIGSFGKGWFGKLHYTGVVPFCWAD